MVSLLWIRFFEQNELILFGATTSAINPSLFLKTLNMFSHLSFNDHWKFSGKMSNRQTAPRTATSDPSNWPLKIKS